MAITLSDTETSKVACVTVPVLLSIHSALLMALAWNDSPVSDEFAYLPAGVRHLTTRRFDLYRANPPLIRMMAAVPAVIVGYHADWRRVDGRDGARSDFFVGEDFAAANGVRVFLLVALGRTLCISFSVLSGYLCYRWSRERFGDASGLFALVLWTFCPTVLAYGHLFTPDAGCTSLGLAANYCFCRWYRRQNIITSVLCGVTLGLAELTKVIWLCLYIVWPLSIIVLSAVCRPSQSIGKSLIGLSMIMLISIIVINCGYFCERPCEPLGTFEFGSNALTRMTPTGKVNVFTGGMFDRVPAPLPANFLLGIDSLLRSADAGHPNYLRGQWRREGWWYYYLYCGCVKIPCGTLILLACSIVLSIRQILRSSVQPQLDDIVLALTTGMIMIMLSWQTGINRHFRYVLPVAPALYIYISGLTATGLAGFNSKWLARQAHLRWLWRSAIFSLVTWSIVSSIAVLPHSISYFNEIAGGPFGGPRHVLGTNIDWGQDLFYLRKWAITHRSAQPLFVAYYLDNYVPPSLLGIQCERVPAMPVSGWYVLSVHYLYGDRREGAVFRQLTPCGSIGYSMYIYHLTIEDAKMLRQAY